MISASSYVNAGNAGYQGAQHAMMTKRLMSELEQRAQEYGLGNSYCDGGAMGDEGNHTHSLIIDRVYPTYTWLIIGGWLA